MAKRRGEIAGAAQLILVPGTVLLHPEEGVFEAMPSGWIAQMRSRLLAKSSIAQRIRTVRRFTEFTNEYPWKWSAADLEDWTSQLTSSEPPLAHSTVRGYQLSVAMFLDYLIDSRYGWAEQCETRFSTHPTQICHEWNMVTHTNGYEGRPEARPFTRDEVQALFDHADEKVARASRLGRKGWAAAFRDATLFKVIYAWGLRRREAARLDVSDFTRNPAAPEFGDFGMLSVRWGKAVKGSLPRRRNVLTVMDWAVEAVEQYLTEIRPFYGDGAALWPTERAARVVVEHINHRFSDYRDALGLPDELHPHCLRHSYVTHLIEDGFDPFFVQQQVGHQWGSTTALYTGVSSDYKNRVLRRALDGVFEAPSTGATGRLQGGEQS